MNTLYLILSLSKDEAKDSCFFSSLLVIAWQSRKRGAGMRFFNCATFGLFEPRHISGIPEGWLMLGNAECIESLKRRFSDYEMVLEIFYWTLAYRIHRNARGPQWRAEHLLATPYFPDPLVVLRVCFPRAFAGLTAAGASG